jgi:hypothetical protein
MAIEHCTIEVGQERQEHVLHPTTVVIRPIGVFRKLRKVWNQQAGGGVSFTKQLDCEFA